MNALKELEDWYRSQRDSEWEHSEGISIDTLDNPGWKIEISLRGTELEWRNFQEHSYGVGKTADTNGDDWLSCKVEEKVFKGFGGPHKLEEMIKVFLSWSSGNSDTRVTEARRSRLSWRS